MFKRKAFVAPRMAGEAKPPDDAKKPRAAPAAAASAPPATGKENGVPDGEEQVDVEEHGHATLHEAMHAHAAAAAPMRAPTGLMRPGPGSQPQGAARVVGQRPGFSVPARVQAPGAGAGGQRPVAAASAAAPSSAGAAAAAAGQVAADDAFYKVLYTKTESFFKKKAAKSYADGVMQLTSDNQATLYNEDGKPTTRGRAKQVTGAGAAAVNKAAFANRREQMAHKNSKKKAKGSDDEEEEDDTVRYELGGALVEVDRALTAASFRSGACFVNGVALPHPGPRVPKASRGELTAQGLAPANRQHAAARPLHDPQAEGALVLNETQWAGGEGRLPSGAPATAVVVDPYIGRYLRPHQQEGVAFLYKCTMQPADPDFFGCILADEMGLGKTLQLITLIWTMLRQGPSGAPAAAKVLVVTPASLVKQWAKEVTKWLGRERLNAVALIQGPDAPQQITDFTTIANYQTAGVMVASYEAARKYAKSLTSHIDLLVCDEAHRLKSTHGNKTVDALLALGCRRRVLLTGTPVQNNLDEFYALLSFVAPGVLGTPAVFKRVYSDPISKGRDRDAGEDERNLGEDRARELGSKVQGLILRRTQEVLAKHLPPLHQCVVFCRPSDIQHAMYRHVLSKATQPGASLEDNCLALITALRKVCNAPRLITRAATAAENKEAAGGSGGAVATWLRGMPQNCSLEGMSDVESSGKLAVLSRLLAFITGKGQRCVVVSTSTAVLDLIDEAICQEQGYRTVRIDGSTNVNDRQAVVDSFNLHGVGQVFFLSTRAGGAGLNLIGANNLVLVDSDWNPAADLQAMARIWRDGQKRPCHVYRLVTSGSIEEKVYQRQVMKGDLATATIDGDAPSTSASAPKAKAKAAAGGGGGGSFTREELRKLFAPMRKAGAEGCETMELLAGTTDGSSSHPHLLTWLDISANSAGSGGAGGGSGAGGDGSGGGGEPSQVVASLADSVAACL
ncbi:hypothetical protein FOA52_014594, partial [Chlamydomonas sp. UWO 241]